MRAFIGVATTPYKKNFADMGLAGVSAEVIEYYWTLARLNQKIYDSVRRAGAVPIELLPAEDGGETALVAERLDGFIFAGGDDMHPRFYGEPLNGSLAPYEERDVFEIGLFKRVLETGKPILGICRGAQVINVALGGTLYQHLADVRPEWAGHERHDVMEGCVHDVEVLRSDFFGGVGAGERLNVNSMHHQAVKSLAPSLRPGAVSADGLVEAFALPEHKYLMCVQWHPECLSGKDPVQAGLFEAVANFSK